MDGFGRRLGVGLLGLVGVVVLAAVAMGVVGWFLPREHVAARAVVIAQAPATVWQVVADHGAEPTWRPGLAEAVREADRAGDPTWTYVYAAGQRVTLVDDLVHPPTRLRRRVLGDDGFTGAWDVALAPEGSGTRVVVTERGEIANPLRRFAARFVVGHERGVDLWLKALGRRFGQGVLPDDAPPSDPP